MQIGSSARQLKYPMICVSVSRATYPLKLAYSIKKAAQRLAKEDGVSLNQWIAAAVAEKVGVIRHFSQSFGGHFCAPWMTFAISTMSLRIRYTTTKGSGGKGSSRVPSTRPVLPLFGKDFNEPALSQMGLAMH